jgi:flagellar biogenesis protein FliO
MKKLALRIVAASLPAIALASGDTGTGAVSEMQVSGKQFMMMIGALLAMGVIVYGVAKMTSGSSKKKG